MGPSTEGAGLPITDPAGAERPIMDGWVRAAPAAEEGPRLTEPPAPAAPEPLPREPPQRPPTDPAPSGSAPSDPVPLGSMPADPVPPEPDDPPFILYKAGDEFGRAVADLALWVHGLLVPVYGREISSTAPWCPRWYEHTEAVAQLYGLWMAWQDLTGSRSPLTGPAMWHRDFLTPTMNNLRDPSGVFAGCKPGQHRPKEPPPVEEPRTAIPPG